MDAARSPLFSALPERLDAFHWHGDTFTLPDGALHAARSAACEHQAFSWGDRVAALQFHPEMTPSIASALVEIDAADLAHGGSCIQRPTEILAPPARFEAMRPVLWDVLDRLTAISAQSTGPLSFGQA